jgi:HEAT repeat protein
MVEATKSENGDLRAMATEALGYIGDEDTVPLLEELLEDPYTVAGKRKVAVAASRSLKMITGKEYGIDK